MLKSVVKLPSRLARTCSHRRTQFLLALLLSVMLVPAPVAADQELYDVEVIVFRHLDSGGMRSGERWPRTVPVINHERYAELESGAEPGSEVFMRLPEGNLTLRDTARRLQQDSGYEVLMHLGWRQPGFAEQDSVAIALPLGSRPSSEAAAPGNGLGSVSGEDDQRPMEFLRPPEGLSGQIRIARERFLHADIDLRYVETRNGGDSRRAALPQFDDLDPIILMQERRRMRSDQLHYLDHPVLGVLIRITRAD
ncbi:MAG: peptidoglycan binding protein CsiV [Ectothiorhodospiraceae bacterium]|nr:hypothetical protein [Paracoccaceae bacterium]MCH8506012.1 peptidoglycan binding protein CsiV [Ectothiorhodospiraceae bacterium]